MTRILIISPMLPGIGGVSVSSSRLVLNLKNDGYNVSVFNIRYHNPKHNTPIPLALRYFLIPFFVIFQTKFDIIHCHVPGVLRKLYIAMFKLFFKGAKLVYSIHGDAHPLVDNRYAKYALGKADKIICVKIGDTKTMPDSLKSKSVDIPAFILPHTISYEYIPSHILQFCKTKANDKLLIFNGAAIVDGEWNDLYGFKDMLNAFRTLETRGNYRMLMILNGEPKNKKSEELVNWVRQEVKGNPHIKFVENEPFELCPLFNYADLYVRPTKTDGDSLSIREALAMGCKVVTTSVVERPKGVFLYEQAIQLSDTIEKTINLEFEPIEIKEYYHDIKNLYSEILQ